jgi:hypothetical protein
LVKFTKVLLDESRKKSVKIISATHLIALVTFLHVSPSFGQDIMDPSTASLNQGGGSLEPEDLDSSRFTVKPVVTPTAPDKPEIVVIKRKKKVEASTKIEVKPTPAASLASTEPPTPAPPPATEHHSLTDQVKVLVLGNDEQIDEFHKQIHPADRRNNRVEITVAPTYVYEGSSSNYSFRQFTFQSPAINANAKVWLTPFFGVQADYTSTFDAMVKSPSAQQMVAINHQDIEIGLRFRKHFGLTRKSSSLTWGLDFIQITDSIPTDTADRVSTSTSGVSVSMQGDFPSSTGYSTFVGVELQPRLVHSENSDNNIHSGGRNETDAVGAWLGGDWLFDRQHQMFWKVHHRIEQNVFDGSASNLDPVSGVTPNGVSTTNSTTLFSIGYRWGS